MVEAAIPSIPVRKAPRAVDRDPWIGPGRALAGQIWGVNYAGTIPSYGIPVASPSNVFAAVDSYLHNTLLTVGAAPSTPVVWPPGIEDIYWQAFRPTSDIGVAVWEGECLISLPRVTPPAPDFSFWTNEGLGESSILIVAEAKLSNTDPADSTHEPAWRRIFESQSPRSLRSGEREREPAPASRDIYEELQVLVAWTCLPVEQLGELLGASRRTMYNWFAGRPIRSEAQSRILRIRDAIAPVANSRDPVLVRDWLLRGDPSPAMLVSADRWDELETRVVEETAPVRPIDATPEEEGAELWTESPKVLDAALLAFSTAPARTTARRSEWKPRELTGITSEDEEDAE